MRLNRQPCPTCNADTLHRGMLCLTCNVARMAPSDSRRAKHKARIAKLIVTKGKRRALEQMAYERAHHDYLRSMDQKDRGVRSIDLPGYFKHPGKNGQKTRGFKAR